MMGRGWQPWFSTMATNVAIAGIALWDEGRRRLISFHEIDRCYASHRNSVLDGRQSCPQLSDNRRLRYLLSVAGSPPSIVKKGPEYPRPARVLQLAKRLGLDLADALASDGERVAYFL
jgi:hypothetical protein